MPFNGSGTFVPPGSDFPAATGTTISSTKYNNVVNDVADGLTNCVTRDGQSPMTNDLPMGSNSITGADAVSAVTVTASSSMTTTGTQTVTNGGAEPTSLVMSCSGGVATVSATWTGGDSTMAFSAVDHFTFNKRISVTGNIEATGTATVGDLNASSVYSSNAIYAGGTGSLIGYSTGAGGTVTQLTSKSTGVTLNRPCGQITMHNANLNAGAIVTFILTNSLIAAESTVCVTMSGNSYGMSSYNIWAGQMASGQCVIAVKNISAGNLAEPLLLNFIVLNSVTS